MIQFSVVIPLYNKKQHIERAINSVLSQTYKRFEIVIVNDGSNDGGDELVRCYGSKVKLITQDNLGVSIARNRGIAQAQHEFICLLDADDEWKPNFLDEIASLIEIYPDKQIYSVKHEIITENNKLLIPTTPFAASYHGVLKNFIKTYRKYDCIINASSVCLKKSYFQELGGFPAGQNQGEDVYLWLLYGIYTDIVFSNSVCTRYYKNATNRSTTRADHLPFQFTYFYKLILSSNNVNKVEKSKPDLLKFLQKDAILHIGDLIVRNKSRTAIEHASSLYKYNKVTGFLCFILIALPKTALKYIQTVRNIKKCSP